MYIIMCVFMLGKHATEGRKAGKRGVEKGEEEGKTDSCRGFFPLPSSKLSCHFSHLFSTSPRSHAVHSVRLYNKDCFNLYLSLGAAEFAYTIKLKIAVCTKLSTTK